MLVPWGLTWPSWPSPTWLRSERRESTCREARSRGWAWPGRSTATGTSTSWMIHFRPLMPTSVGRSKLSLLELEWAQIFQAWVGLGLWVSGSSRAQAQEYLNFGLRFTKLTSLKNHLCVNIGGEPRYVINNNSAYYLNMENNTMLLRKQCAEIVKRDIMRIK